MSVLIAWISCRHMNDTNTGAAQFVEGLDFLAGEDGRRDGREDYWVEGVGHFSFFQVAVSLISDNRSTLIPYKVAITPARTPA